MPIRLCMIFVRPRCVDRATQTRLIRGGNAMALDPIQPFLPMRRKNGRNRKRVTDPEHPLTLEQLAVVNEEHITVDTGNENTSPSVVLEFTPTIPHCSMATLIGLSLRVRLLRALPTHYKLGVLIRPGTHQSAGTINKQLSDKERVAAAVENKYLMGVIQGCLSTAGLRGIPA